MMMNLLSQGGIKAQEAFGNDKLQKFIHRELTIYDSLVRGHKATYSTKFQRWNPVVRTGISRRLGDERLYDDDDGRADAETTVRGGSEAAPSVVDHGDVNIENRIDGGEGEKREEMWYIDVPKPTDPSPYYNSIYGLHMLSQKQYQIALCKHTPIDLP